MVSTTNAGLPKEIAQFLTKLVRDSSHQTYESIWQSWGGVCTTNELEVMDASAAALIRSLWHLFHDNVLAALTLGLHWVAVSLTTALCDMELQSSRLSQCFMLAMFLSQPPVRTQGRGTWEVACASYHGISCDCLLQMDQ